MDVVTQMKTATDLHLISDSTEFTSAIYEQFFDSNDFRLVVVNADDIEPSRCSAVPSALTILALSTPDSYLLDIVDRFQTDFPKSNFLLIHKGADRFKYFSRKLRAPFRFSHLLKMLRQTIETEENQPDLWLFSRCEYNPIDKVLKNEAEEFHRLTEKEAAILSYLYEAKGEPVSRETLLKELWGYHSDTETHTVETHIYRLRQKMEKDLGQSRIIITDHLGYRLVR